MRINPNMKLKYPTYRPNRKEVSEDFTLAVMAEARKMAGKMDDVTAYHVASAYSTIYTKVSKERKNFMRDMDRHRDFYIVDVMVNTVVYDALSPDTTTGKILEITSNNPELKKELEVLKKRINFDQLLQDVVPELCFNGDYFLKTKIDKVGSDKDNKIVKDELDQDLEDDGNTDKDASLAPVKKGQRDCQGLLEVKDILDQAEIIPLTQDGKRRSYLVQEGGKIYVKHASEYVHFSLGGSRRRIKLFDELSDRLSDNEHVRESLANVPRFIRVGKPIFWGCLSKIRELELLEKLIPATKLSKLSQGTIVGVNLPDTYDLEKGLSAIKRVEGLLNKKIGVDPKLGELTVESIMATSGRYKAIPVFGDKGGIERIDYKETESDDLLSNVKDIRDIICDALGIPSELIFKSDGDNKSNILKRYTRYLKFLKMVQRSLQDGIRQIIKIHIANRPGVSYKDEDIKVEFLNKLSEIDNLDNLEQMDITVSMLKNLKDFVTDFMDEMSPLQVDVDLNIFKTYINKNLATIGLTGMIKDVKLKPKPPEPTDDMDGMGGDDMGDDDFESPDDDQDDIDPGTEA